jgi:hypothetical protein
VEPSNIPATPFHVSRFTFHSASSSENITVTHYLGNKPVPGRIVILASPETRFADADRTSQPPSLARQFLAQGNAVVVVDKFSTGEPPDQFANFFTTYNRTKAQSRVGDLITVCSFARNQLKARQIVLCGTGPAGLWALLAAPAADAVIADCDELDASSDQALLAPDLFCPGIRALGAFEGTALLAAPHPLLLYDTGPNFPTQTLSSTYGALKAGRQFHVESRGLGEAELASWLANIN